MTTDRQMIELQDVRFAYGGGEETGELELTTGEVLPVSRYRLPQVRKKLLDLLNS